MYYTAIEAKQCFHDYKFLLYEFNSALPKQDFDTERIPTETLHNDWDIDELTSQKALFRLKHLLNAPPMRDPRDEYHAANHIRKAYKGIKIACTKNGMPVPNQFDEEVEKNYQKAKQEFEKWKEMNP